MRWIRRASRTLIALYIVYGAAMIYLHPRFIYPFHDRPFELAGFTAQQIAGGEGDGPTVYVHDAGAGAAVVLYFMGNAGSLSYFTSILDHHRMAGHSVIAMGYRGGGGLPGTPSEAVLKRDALAVVDAVPTLLSAPPTRVVAHGYSLGTGLAMHVGRQRQIDQVILSAPYVKMCRLMAQASGLPACVLPGVQKWNSAADADLTVPVVALHGADDALIPIAEGRALVAQITEKGTAPATFIEIPGAGHTDLMRFANYRDAIDRAVSLAGPAGS